MAKSIIKYAPGNLGYYLKNTQLSIKQFKVILKKLQKNYCHYSDAGNSEDFFKFVGLVLEYSTDKELQTIINSPILTFEEHQKDLLEVLLKDPRVTPELIRKTLLANFCTAEARSLEEYQLLNDVLHLEVSDYIQADLLEVADTELFNYLIKQILPYKRW